MKEKRATELLDTKWAEKVEIAILVIEFVIEQNTHNMEWSLAVIAIDPFFLCSMLIHPFNELILHKLLVINTECCIQLLITRFTPHMKATRIHVKRFVQFDHFMTLSVTVKRLAF